MKAILYTRWGPPDVLELHDTEKPAPGPDQVLLRVCASSVNAMEWRPFTMPSLFIRAIAGWREPREKSFGGDVAGIVESVGTSVTTFRPGDQVFGLARGAYAEYVCTTEDKLVLKPANVSFAAAAAVPVAALTALQAVRTRGQVQPGEKVLINGAGGGVGTFAVQIAKASGAEVTAVCSARNQDVARAIGADHVIDYAKDDVTASGRRYDLIVAANGYHSIFDYRRALTANGRLVVLGGAMSQMLQILLLGPLLRLLDRRRYRGFITRPNLADLTVLQQLLETGQVVPAIDRSYSLGQVGDAVKYLIAGHARGKVVITVQADAMVASRVANRAGQL